MITSPHALNELVQALVDGTRSGSVRWKSADARKRAFIAKRPSGTVTLYGGSESLPTGQVRLVVKDRSGNTVDELSTSSFGSVVDPSTGSVVFELQRLYEAVREQVAQSESTVRSLTQEFRQAR